MTDVTTNKRLVVGTDSPGGPYVHMALDQVPDLRPALDRSGMNYYVSEYPLSINGGPYMTYVRFGRRGDATAIQAVLDSLP